MIIPKENRIEGNIQKSLTHEVNLLETQSVAFFQVVEISSYHAIEEDPKREIISYI